MENSHIEWTNNTFNPWIGCTKVSPGCEHCYAEARDQRFAEGKHWGKGAPRQRTSAANWRQPVKWNRDVAARTYGGNDYYPAAEMVRPRVFCASLADWLDDEVPIEWLADLLNLIRLTPNLDWQLLTKRPQNWKKRLTEVRYYLNSIPDSNDLFFWLVSWLEGKAPSNVWIGTTVEDQQRANERIPALLNIPACIRFLSCEPLLGEVEGILVAGIHWVICGGESGPGARPIHPDWAKSLRDQCKAAEVPFFFKQWGEWGPVMPGVGGEFYIDIKGDMYGMPGTLSQRTVAMKKVGKKAAGRMLVMREHNEFPEIEVVA